MNIVSKSIFTTLLYFALVFSQPVSSVCESSVGQEKQEGKEKITVATGEVLLDLIVRDKKFRLVKDLNLDDFEVYEDGVLQKLEMLRVIGNHTPEAGRGAALSDKLATKEGNEKPPDRPLGSFSSVALVFDNLKPDSRQYACAAADEYTKANGSGKDFVSLFAFGVNVLPVQPFTRDMEAVRKGIARIRTMTEIPNYRPGTGTEKVTVAAFGADKDRKLPGTPLPGGLSSSGASTTTGSGGNDPSEALWQAFLADIIDGFEKLELQRRGEVTVDGLLAIIQAQKGMPGRKAIIFFSDELSLTTETAVRFRDVISLANKNNVTIYAVDAAGLRTKSQTSLAATSLNDLSYQSRARADSSGPILGGAISKDMEKNEFLVNNNPNARMQQLASWTGGFLVSDTNGLTQKLGLINEELQTYYLLRYVTTNQNYDGKFRQIEVKLKRPELIVQSRRGYFAIGAGGTVTSYETPVLAVMNNASPQLALPVRTMVLSFPQVTAVARVPVMMQIPSGAFTCVEDKTAKTWSTDFRVVALIKDQNKQVIQKLSHQFRLSGPLDKLEEAKKNGLVFYREAELPTGKYEIEAAAYDTPSLKASVQRSSLEVQAEGEGKLSLSSVIIVQSASKAQESQKKENLFVAGDLLLVPNFGDAIRKSASGQFSFFFTVRPAKGVTATTALLEIVQHGQSLAQLPLPLPVADASGRIQVASSLPTQSIPPGSYELKITVQDGKETISRSAGFTIEP